MPKIVDGKVPIRVVDLWVDQSELFRWHVIYVKDKSRFFYSRAASLVLRLAPVFLLFSTISISDCKEMSRTPARFAGAFVDWGADGRESNMKTWEEDLGQKPSSVIAVDFYGGTTWNDFLKYSWLPAFWKSKNAQRRIVWSVPLTSQGTPLGDVASGLHDAEFRTAAEAIAHSQPSAVIRLGWEMNTSAVAWFAGGRELEYIAAFRRVVGIFRKASSSFKFDWCPGWGSQQSPADLAYPGDDVVDYIGLDVYDFRIEAPGDTWDEHYLNAKFGLNWQSEFAARHGKYMSYPEWGVGQAGDNPRFVANMYRWFMEHATRIAYAAYFNVNGSWPTKLDRESFPLSWTEFKIRFYGGADIKHGAKPEH